MDLMSTDLNIFDQYLEKIDAIRLSESSPGGVNALQYAKLSSQLVN